MSTETLLKLYQQITTFRFKAEEGTISDEYIKTQMKNLGRLGELDDLDFEYGNFEKIQYAFLKQTVFI